MTETPTRYTIVGEVVNITLEAWGAEFKRLADNLHAATWELIDHLALGDTLFADDILQYVEQTDFSPGYLRNLRTIGRQFPFTRRVNLPQLPPAHYQAVNSLEPEDQDEMLWLAYEKDLSRDELRAELRQRGLTNAREVGEVYLENEYLYQRNERLEQHNGDLQAEVDRLKREASAQASRDPLAPVDEAYERDAEDCQHEYVCRRCGELL